tara:strand:+ start:9230 stop:9931 length:702 start_codon:yes stop_codon:yes gene_type:complete
MLGTENSALTDALSSFVVYSSTEVVLNICLAFLLGIVVSSIYKYTHKGMSYSQSFMITLVFVATIVAIVMMVIGNSLARAFALVGALSIIRFRSVVKDTKDMSYIFMALAAGMAAGTSSYFLALFGTGFLAVASLVLDFTNYGSLYKSEFILRFRKPSGDEGAARRYSEVLTKYTKRSELLHVEGSGDGMTEKVTFDIVLKKDVEPMTFTGELAKLDELSEVVFVASKTDVDY